MGWVIDALHEDFFATILVGFFILVGISSIAVNYEWKFWKKKKG